MDKGIWFLLPTLALSDGGLARRVSRVLDGNRLISIVLSATGPLVGCSFELVEHTLKSPLASDPRLGRVLVDGRTVRFGLVEVSRTSLTFTAMSVRADGEIVRALRFGSELQLAVDDETVTVSLEKIAVPIQAAVRSVCDPAHVPIETWLADAG